MEQEGLLKLMSQIEQIVSRHVLANFRNFMTLTTPFVPELNSYFFFNTYA